MNYSDAIECIKKNYPPSNYTILRESLDLAIELLEKQIPKKPVENFYDERDGEDWYDEGYYYSCPCCDNTVGQYSTESEQWIWEMNSYCPNCGQKMIVLVEHNKNCMQ